MGRIDVVIDEDRSSPCTDVERRREEQPRFSTGAPG
jgi:hypothetical protein